MERRGFGEILDEVDAAIDFNGRPENGRCGIRIATAI